MTDTERNCPCCASLARTVLTPSVVLGGTRHALRLLRCKACGHAFLETDKDQHSAIEDDYMHDYAGHRPDPVFELRARAAMVHEIMPLVPPPARLLDVGCGSGAFLDVARSLGYAGTGIDISSGAIATCRERGLHAIEGDVLSHDFGEPFDLVTMWDFLEHLRDPALFVRRAFDLLRSGGILVVKTPGMGRLTIELARVNKRVLPVILHAPHHVQYWTPGSIDSILSRAGFASIIHFPPREFRQKARANSIRRIAKRTIIATIGGLAGNRNIFVAGRK